MSYIKATQLLPEDLLVKIQAYVEGKSIYIPKVCGNKNKWGANTSTREELKIRNKQIYGDYLKGHSSVDLSQRYFLSVKSIQRIIRQQRQFAKD